MSPCPTVFLRPKTQRVLQPSLYGALLSCLSIQQQSRVFTELSFATAILLEALLVNLYVPSKSALWLGFGHYG